MMSIRWMFNNVSVACLQVTGDYRIVSVFCRNDVLGPEVSFYMNTCAVNRLFYILKQYSSGNNQK